MSLCRLFGHFSALCSLCQNFRPHSSATHCSLMCYIPHTSIVCCCCCCVCYCPRRLIESAAAAYSTWRFPHGQSSSYRPHIVLILLHTRLQLAAEGGPQRSGRISAVPVLIVILLSILPPERLYPDAPSAHRLYGGRHRSAQRIIAVIAVVFCSLARMPRAPSLPQHLCDSQQLLRHGSGPP